MKTEVQYPHHSLAVLTLVLLTGCLESEGHLLPPPLVVADPGTCHEVDPVAGWRWVDCPETACLNGSPTGLAISSGASAGKLLIYLQRGGACFSGLTCNPLTARDRFNRDDFAAAEATGDLRGVLDHTDPDNPFRDWTIAFLPYCSADVFIGNNPDGPGGKHLGYNNLGRYLGWLQAAMPAPEQVVVVGSSGGGFGALFSFERIQSLFPNLRITMVSDSAMPLGEDIIKPCLQDQWRKAWSVDSTLPPDCAACKSTSAFVQALTTRLFQVAPDNRLAFIDASSDKVLRTFYGFGHGDIGGCGAPAIVPANEFCASLRTFRDVTLAPAPNATTYFADSDQHVVLTHPFSEAPVAERPLATWLSDVVSAPAAPAKEWARQGCLNN